MISEQIPNDATAQAMHRAFAVLDRAAIDPNLSAAEFHQLYGTAIYLLGKGKLPSVGFLAIVTRVDDKTARGVFQRLRDLGWHEALKAGVRQ